MKSRQPTAYKNNIFRTINIVSILIIIQLTACINEVEENLLSEWQNYREAKLLYSNSDGVSVFNIKTGISIITAKNGEIMNYYPYGTEYQRSYAGEARWSPDGKKVVYTEEAGGTDYSQITVMNADGSNKKVLVSVGIPLEPEWSPEGLEIVYTKSIAKFRSNTEVFIINVDGTNERQLTNFSEDVSDPSFSRDGQKIIFSSEVVDSVSNRQLFIINRDGSGVAQLTYSTELFNYAGGASWSPTDDEIVFSGKDNKEPDYEIFLLKVSNNYVSKLTNTTLSNFDHWDDNVFLKWSNDGQFIMYTKYPNGLSSGSRPSPSVWGMKPDGSGQEQIISNAQQPDLYLSSY